MSGPMASGPRSAPRVQYLADLGRPLLGAALSRAHVLSAGPRVVLSAGDHLVHVFERGGQRLSAVFEFPAPIWHLELLPGPCTLLVLCPRCGLYRVSLQPADRDGEDSRDGEDRVDNTDRGDGTGSLDDRDSGHGVVSEPPLLRTTVRQAACILPDPTLSAFTLWGDTLVTVVQTPARWKVHLTPYPAASQDRVLAPLDRGVDLPAGTAPAWSPGQLQAPFELPVLCLVAPPGPGGLDAVLFGLLFGADACLLRSPVLLCGLPGGQLCALYLQALVTSGWASGEPHAPIRTLYHLEEAVLLVGVLRTEPPAEGLEDVPSDCLVALGQGGRLLAAKAGRDEAGSPVLELREYRVPGPVLCATCDGSRLITSTPSGVHMVDLAQSRDPREPSALPSNLCPISTSMCSLVALTVPPRAAGGDAKLLALSTRGRLLTCSLALSEWLLLAGGSRAGGGQHIGDLLSAIAAMSERVASLKARAEQQNQVLQGLNQAVAVTSALLGGQEGPKPVSCHLQTSWAHLPSGDTLLVHCVLNTSPAFSLGPGWTLCVRLLPALWVVGPTDTYTLPLGALGPNAQRSMTLSLVPSEDGALRLPLTVSCWLFFSLRDAVGDAVSPRALPKQEGMGLPLSRHVVDMLHVLRFPDPPTPAPCQPPRDPVDAFLRAQCGPGTERGDQYLPPSEATLTVSARLLRAALADQSLDVPLGPATLQWLLLKNTDAAKAPARSCLQGQAPDGSAVRLLVREVCVRGVSPAGPLQAVEIRVESPSLAVLCAVHHAVTRRVQMVLMEQASCDASPPDLCVQHLNQVQAGHEAMLREIWALQEQLRCGEEAAPATAQRLLLAFQRLRSPGPLLL